MKKKDVLGEIEKINKQIGEVHTDVKLSSLDAVYITVVIAILSFLLSIYFLDVVPENLYVLIFAQFCLIVSLSIRVITIYSDRDKVNARMRSDFLATYSFIFGVMSILSALFPYRHIESTSVGFKIYWSISNALIFMGFALLLLLLGSFICIKINKCYIRKFPNEKRKLKIKSDMLLFYPRCLEKINRWRIQLTFRQLLRKNFF